jgi:hypothetical protein
MIFSNRVVDDLVSATKQADPEAGTCAVSGWLPAKLQDTYRSGEELIRRHPGVSLAAAVTVGVFLGWWVKRR